MSPTGINYLDETWNPVTGCTHAGSPGCDNCWARELHERRHKAYRHREKVYGGSGIADFQTIPAQYAKPFSEIQSHKKRFDQPLRWRKPRVIGVCFGGDLLHDDVPTREIWRVFSAMRIAPQHTYLVLTKRPERMRGVVREMLMASSKDPDPNVWLGVTVCNQQEADEKIPILMELAAMGWHVWVSYEPALGGIGLKCSQGPSLELIVCGGESGKNARPDNPDWYRKVRDDCATTGCKFYMKQMSSRKPIPDDLMVRQLPWEASDE